MRKMLSISAAACALLATSGGLFAQEWTPNREQLVDAYPAPAYSPYAGRTFPERPLWGDTHLHTGQSLDAGGFGARLTHADAYRFARGEEVMASSGQPVRLSRPLDWLAITDHSDGMGLITDALAANPTVTLSLIHI